jgi:lysophospholipase L1-like esterase
VALESISFPKKILFSLVIVVIFFLIIEGILHLAGFKFQPQYSIYAEEGWTSHGVQQDPTLPWSWLPAPGALCHIDGRVDFRFNSLGFRGPLFEKQKTPGTVRIICMGDSGTMGWGVKDGQMYCSDVQGIVERKCGKQIETINAGVFGFSSFQGVHLLKNKILELHPDIITICYNWNDHADAIRIAKLSGKYAWEHGVPTSDKNLYHSQSYAGLFQMVNRLRLIQFMQLGALKINELKGTKSDPQASNSEKDLLRVPLEDYKQNLEQMIGLARENKIVPILLTQAMNPKRAEITEMQLPAKRQQQYNAAVREIAAKQNVLCIDPVPVLEADARFFNSNTHPTKGGHHLIALLLADAICSMNK